MDKEPHISPNIYEYFKKVFNLDYLLTNPPKHIQGHQETLGYVKGVNDVLLRLKILSNRESE